MGCPLDTCIENKNKNGENNYNSTRNNVQIRWLSQMDGQMSLITLKIRM